MLYGSQDRRLRPLGQLSSTPGGNRTLTPMRAKDFKSHASTVPPRGHYNVNNRLPRGGREGYLFEGYALRPTSRSSASLPQLSPSTPPTLESSTWSWTPRLPLYVVQTAIVEPRGVEPRSQPCKGRVFPLDDGPILSYAPFLFDRPLMNTITPGFAGFSRWLIGLPSVS